MILTNLNSNPQVHELVSRKSTVDQNIEDLKRKIAKMENTLNDDPLMDDMNRDYPSPLGSSRLRSHILEDMKSSSSKMFKSKTGFAKKQERSGTSFVNQLSNDINRLLTRKGGSNPTPSMSQSGSMVQSYYLNQ